MVRRLAVLRRRRRRGSGASLAVFGALLALGAPLALGQTAAQAPAPATLTSGSSGTAVSALQAALGLGQTGRFTASTLRAVRSFQRSHGLTVDGIVGPQTAAALGLPSSTAQAVTPATVNATAAGVTATGGAVSSDAGGSATLQKIAQCESGGDPTAVSGDRQYRGKYQFSRATWEQMGGTGDPAAAPETEQDRIAGQLLAQRGTTPWPTCGRGLSQG
jgi:peptidoglycan hydrolase-like protein with peptidoglycan-binding domain